MTAVEPALAGELDRDGAALSAYLRAAARIPTARASASCACTPTRSTSS